MSKLPGVEIIFANPALAAGLAVGAGVGVLTSVYGTRAVMKASAFLKNEAAQNKGTWKETLCKVAQWTTSTGAAAIGTAGVLLSTAGATGLGASAIMLAVYVDRFAASAAMHFVPPGTFLAVTATVTFVATGALMVKELMKTEAVAEKEGNQEVEQLPPAAEQEQAKIEEQPASKKAAKPLPPIPSKAKPLPPIP